MVFAVSANAIHKHLRLLRHQRIGISTTTHFGQHTCWVCYRPAPMTVHMRYTNKTYKSRLFNKTNSLLAKFDVTALISQITREAWAFTAVILIYYAKSILPDLVVYAVRAPG